MLTKECNGSCDWCIEKDGYHPKEQVGWKKIARAIIGCGKTNIILLGGEPTLYKDLDKLIPLLSALELNTYITTNGSQVTADYICRLVGLKGLNISIHHYDLVANRDITGIEINEKQLQYAIIFCKKYNITVRMNCNLISGNIDSETKILSYIAWAQSIGADNIRFSELKQSNLFVDAAKIFNYKYGLNDDPFVCGCSTDANIGGMPVSFRQMCGLQTPERKKPVNPEQKNKQVLYYDGVLYNGWQSNKASGPAVIDTGCQY